MFRILAECSKVEVDDALSLAIEKVKEMQNSGQLSGIAGSIKIPDFINGGMLKMLPKDKKMELMEQSMHQEKSRIMAMLQPAISRVIGPVQILDFQMKAMPAAGLDATMRVDVEILDADRVIDLITEKLIEEGMDSLMSGRTTFVIAHRLSTVRNADEIIVLEHGNIIERGTHDELIAAKGRYYFLYTGNKITLDE